MTEGSVTNGNEGVVAEGLVRYYGKWRVVSEVSMEVRRGEVVGLLGPYGAGKTPTFYMVVGLLRPSSGRIRLNGEDITDEPMYRRARMGLGYLAQEPSIFRRLTVRQNIIAVLETMKLTKAARQERLAQLLVRNQAVSFGNLADFFAWIATLFVQQHLQLVVRNEPHVDQDLTKTTDCHVSCLPFSNHESQRCDLF